MTTNKIEIKDLTVNYTENKRSFNALTNVSFNVADGEFVSVIGASGCGKSTLLSVLEGLYAPAGGSVKIDGEELHGTGSERGVVFQHYSLFPWMTTKKNIEFGIKQARHDIKRSERSKIADEFLSKVGLGEFGRKYPSQLSGGMQQRAAIARALAMDTQILLMDEPFSAIDAKNRVVLQELLIRALQQCCLSLHRRERVTQTRDDHEFLLTLAESSIIHIRVADLYASVHITTPPLRSRCTL